MRSTTRKHTISFVDILVDDFYLKMREEDSGFRGKKFEESVHFKIGSVVCLSFFLLFR